MYDLGLTSEQFWELTPGQFAALSRRHDDCVLRQEAGPGIITSTLLNINRDPKRKPDPFKAEDFMPSFEKPEQTAEQFKHRLMAAFPPAPKKPKEDRGK